MRDKRFWQVYFTVPSERSNGMKYQANKHCGVVAKDVQSVIDEIMQHFPQATIMSVQHRGVADYVVLEGDLLEI